MSQNYLIAAWRNITRRKVFSLINILGLALGLCACLVIYLTIQYEFSFDRFHPDKERIYRVVSMRQTPDRRGELETSIPPPAPTLIRQDVSGLDAVAGFFPFWADIEVPGRAGKKQLFSSEIEGTNCTGTVFADAGLFAVFSFDWLAGNSASALATPNQVVLAESRARLYFGDLPMEKILGRELIYRDSLRVRVSGIVKDWNQNTDLHFTDVISLPTINSSRFLQDDPRIQLSTTEWKNHRSISCFVKLSPQASSELVRRQLAAFPGRHIPSTAGDRLSMNLQGLTDLHFSEFAPGDDFRKASRQTLAALSALALFILVIAICNFINLSTAQSMQRAREMGIRKVMGGNRASLVLQFLTETFLHVAPAAVIAILLSGPVVSLFHDFLPPQMAIRFTTAPTLGFLLFITVVTTLLAGVYPAWVVSAHLPVTSLKGSRSAKGSERWLLRKGLTVLQFTLSLGFIIGAIVIGNQLRFIQDKDLGLTTKAVIEVPTPHQDSVSNVTVLGDRFRRIAGVAMVAKEILPPVGDPSFGLELEYNGKREQILTRGGDENLIPLYQLRLLAGRNLQHGGGLRELVINETYAKSLGFSHPADALGKFLLLPETNPSGQPIMRPLPIVGVVADFNEYSLREAIRPMVIADVPQAEDKLAVKLDIGGKGIGDMKQVIAEMEQTWKEVYPQTPFAHTFLDETIGRMYASEHRTAVLINVAMFITIFISCMGLFGLTLFTIEKKTKEIGIRKVLGAGIGRIIWLLTRDVLFPVMLALAIASPVAWYFANGWLQAFVYRVAIHWWMFALAGVGAVALALLTIGFQTLRAALANPINALRNE